MKDIEKSTESYNKEVEDWVNSARQQIRTHSIEKSLLYSYDFSQDRPIRNAYSRLVWEISPIISPKSILIRSSSASQARGSSLSTAVATDFELLDFNLPHFNPDAIDLSDHIPSIPRVSAPFCLRKRLGSGQFNNFIFKPFSRSKSF